MSRPLKKLRRFFRELKRRNVYKVAIAYLAVAFMGIQAARLLVPPTTLPAWADDLLIYLAVFGFPVALVIAWAFEITPEGVQRTPRAEPTEEGAGEPGSGTATGYKVLVALGLIAGAVVGGWYLTGGGGVKPDVSDRSVAVLPFEFLGEPSSHSLTEGVHNALINRLQQVSDLTVIARKSVLRYADLEDTDMTLTQVAEELGAKWIVAGTVQEAGGEILVKPRLIDPRTETERWSKSYRRDLSAGSVFELQGEITKSVARSLEAELSADEIERLEREPTEDLQAYRLYAEGRRLFDQRTVESVAKAATSFEGALERDSSFALAWAGLAEAMATPFFVGEDEDPGVGGPDLPGPHQAARRALRPDPIWYHHLTAVEAAAGDTARAKRHLARLEEREAPPYLLAVAQAAVGEVDSVVTAYGRIEDWPWVAVLELRYIWTEALGPLRNDPRYEGLIRRVNVAWGLNPDGSLPEGVDVSFG